MVQVYRKSDPTFAPYRASDGCYHAHRRFPSRERNRAIHRIKVRTIEELSCLITSGEFAIRMAAGGKSREPSLICRSDIVVVEE